MTDDESEIDEESKTKDKSADASEDDWKKDDHLKTAMFEQYTGKKNTEEDEDD